MRKLAYNVDNRRAVRLDVRMGAVLREAGSLFKFEVDVIDLSVTGVRFETSFTLKRGNQVYMTFPKLAPLEATVAWGRGFVYGCEFDHPLHNAVFDHIVAQYRKA